jgi:hypothetical protein
MGGFAVALLQPALGFGGRLASPIIMTSLMPLASRPVDVSGALASIALPPEPPVPPPTPPVPADPPAPLLVPPLPDVVGPVVSDVVGPLVVEVPPLPPDDDVVEVGVPFVPDEVVSDDESEHATKIKRKKYERIETAVLGMSDSRRSAAPGLIVLFASMAG